MELRQISKGIINHYDAIKGSRMVRISEDTEVKRVTLTTWVNYGETITSSHSYKTVKGAAKFAEEWLNR